MDLCFGDCGEPPPSGAALGAACAIRSFSDAMRSASSFVADRTTVGAHPAWRASSQREAHRHQRSPGFNPGNPNSGRGVDRSFPRVRVNSRNASVTMAQTVCEPRSIGPVSQQPFRKTPVTGSSEHVASGRPRTFRCLIEFEDIGNDRLFLVNRRSRTPPALRCRRVFRPPTKRSGSWISPSLSQAASRDA